MLDVRHDINNKLTGKELSEMTQDLEERQMQSNKLNNRNDGYKVIIYNRVMCASGAVNALFCVVFLMNSHA